MIPYIFQFFWLPIKIHIFWEGHKNITQSPNFFYERQIKIWDFDIFLAFSVYMNFTYIFYGFHDFHAFSFLHFYNAKLPIQTYSINFSYGAQWGKVFPEEEFLSLWNNVFIRNVFNLHNISISMFHEIRMLFPREFHFYVAA